MAGAFLLLWFIVMILFTQGGKKYPKNALYGCSAGFRRLDSQNFSRRGATFGLLAGCYVTAPAKNSTLVRF